MKHTKGPWHIISSDHTVVVDSDPSEEGARIIAKVWDNRWSSKNVYSDDYCEGIANARLIAEAPEMYEAMKEAIRWAQASDEMPSAKIAHITLGLSKILARIEGEGEGL